MDTLNRRPDSSAITGELKKINPSVESESSKPPVNLLTNKEATIAALVAMEGQEWIDDPSYGGEESLREALEAVAAGREGMIYGAGGSNRYFVSPDGAVRLRKRNIAMESDIQKAEALGFKVE